MERVKSFRFPPPLAAVLATLLFLPTTLSGQAGRARMVSDTLRVTSVDSVLYTSSRYVQLGSESVQLEGGPYLRRGADYTLDAFSGRIVLAPLFLRQLDPSRPDSRIILHYQTLPVRFRDSYSTASAGHFTWQGVSVVAPAPRVTSADQDWFGPGLQRSGSITRGFMVGTNRDASLASGLRLQMSGALARDVNILAALSDENSPLQPEGSTQTLREVDRVFIDISGNHYGVTLGDFVYAREGNVGGAFGRVSRKYQGVQGLIRDLRVPGGGVQATVGVVGASSRGKFHTNRFQGSDGNQGPYRVTGKNGESRLIVIAGSERVTINGETMVRGEVQDYVIDYASGELTFTGKRRITSASRIVIDFEYADRQYARNALGASLDAVVGDSLVVVHSGILQEADDEDAPLDFTLDESLRSLLRSSGADRLRASLSSVRNVGVDTATGRGSGQYIAVDTLLQGRQVTIYRYAPGDPSAVFVISFAPVERMPADSAGYVRISAGEYRFAGLGAGTYLPLQFIPVPQLQRTAHATVAVRPFHGVVVHADVAGSVFDQNRLSSLDDDGNAGSAYEFGVQISPGPMRWGEWDLGEFSLRAAQRSRSTTFVSAERIESAEYERLWDLPVDRSSGEIRREADISLRPRHWITLQALAGTVDRAGDLSSQRIGASGWLQDSVGRRLAFDTETLDRDLVSPALTSHWRRHNAIAAVPWGAFVPSLAVRSEDRSDGPSDSDSLVEGSFRMVEWAPRLSWNAEEFASASAEVQFRSEDSAAAGVRSRAFDAVTQSFALEVRPWRSVRSSLDLNIRTTSFTEEFRRRGNGDATTLLVRSHTRFNSPDRVVDGDALYEFSNQRSSRLERVFIRVARGSGNYRYSGDTNGNGIADEAEYELVRFDGDYVAFLLPGETLVPVNDLKASVRLRWSGRRMDERSTPVWLSALSTETLLRVEERSSDPVASHVYGLNLASFLRSSSTISGAQTATQDVHVYEGDPRFAVRFRWTERRGLTQMVTAPERTYGGERSLRVRHRWTVEIGQQTDLWVRRDRMLSSVPNPRERDLTNVGGTADFTYQIERRWEAGWTLGLSSITDARGGREVEAALNELAVRIVYGIPSVGQVRSEVRREEARLTATSGAVPTVLPFELTDGRAIGRSWLWRISADLQLTSLIQLSAGYFGRQEGTGPVVHTAHAEARATF